MPLSSKPRPWLVFGHEVDSLELRYCVALLTTLASLVFVVWWHRRRSTASTAARQCDERQVASARDSLNLSKGHFGSAAPKKAGGRAPARKAAKSTAAEKPMEKDANDAVEQPAKTTVDAPAKNAARVHFADADGPTVAGGGDDATSTSDSADDEPPKCGVDGSRVTRTDEAQLKTFFEQNQDNLCGRFVSMRNQAAAKRIEASMTAEERDEENKVRKQQMEQIFKLMAAQKDKFPGGKLADEDITEQMRLYALH